MASITEPSIAKPSAGASIQADQVTLWLDALQSFIEGTNIEESNVDLLGEEGLVGKAAVQTITGTKTFDNTADGAGGVRTGATFSTTPGSITPADNDGVELVFKGRNAVAESITYGKMQIVYNTVADASEASEFVFSSFVAASSREVFSVGSQGTVFNEDSQDLNFRIETNNIANGFNVDAGDDVFAFGAVGADDKFVKISPPAATHSATNDTYALYVTAGGAQTIPAGTTALVASLAVEEPNITATGTVTNAATVYIKNAPDEGDTGNYALWIDAGASQLDGTLTVGVNDTGHDVKFFGATSGQYVLWDESADELVLAGDTKLSFHDAAGGENIIASADGHLEVNAGTTLDITAPTVDLNSATEFNIDTAAYDLNASGAVTIDSAGVSIDSSTASNLTTSGGALTITSAAAATWSTSAGALTINGTGGVNIQEGGSTIIGVSDSRVLATTNTASVDLDATGAIQINSSGGVISVANDNVDQTVNLATAGTRTLNIGILDGTDTTTITSKGNQTHSGTITVGVDDTGYDVKFFGATASAYMLWDESADDLILAGAAGLIVPDNKLTLGSTAVTSTAAELNIMDGGTSATSTTIADADRVVLNDNGTMKQVAVTDLNTYITTVSLATNVTVTANDETNETVYLTFVDGVSGSQGIETDAGLTYNPSTELLSTTALTASGAVSTGALTSTGNISFDGGSFIFNESGADKDFRVESDTKTHALFVEGSDGSVGIGKAPLAWHADYTGVQIGGNGAINSYTPTHPDGYFEFMHNTQYDTDGTYEYISTGEAGRYRQYNGTHLFGTAPSGTAGNDITFTDRMAITSAGIGVGTAAPDLISDSSYPNVLTLFGSTTGNDKASLEIASRRSGASSEVGRLSFWNAEAAGNRLIAGIIAETGESGTSYATERGQLGFYTTTTASTGNGVLTERMRIDSNGDVFIGTGAALAVDATGGFLYIPSMNGDPTGTPVAQDKLSAIVHDTDSNRLYLYDHDDNEWQYVALTSA